MGLRPRSRVFSSDRLFAPAGDRWAIVEFRMAFAAIALIVYIPLFRSISLRRLPALSPGIENPLAAEESA